MKFKLQSPFWFVAEVFRALYARLRGFELLAAVEVEEARLEKCQVCPFLDQDTDQCTICTCWTPAKVKIAVSQCPKGFWRAVFVRKGLTINEK